jgi:hypothetical protein
LTQTQSRSNPTLSISHRSNLLTTNRVPPWTDMSHLICVFSLSSAVAVKTQLLTLLLLCLFTPKCGLVRHAENNTYEKSSSHGKKNFFIWLSAKNNRKRIWRRNGALVNDLLRNLPSWSELLSGFKIGGGQSGYARDMITAFEEGIWCCSHPFYFLKLDLYSSAARTLLCFLNCFYWNGLHFTWYSFLLSFTKQISTLSTIIQVLQLAPNAKWKHLYTTRMSASLIQYPKPK